MIRNILFFTINYLYHSLLGKIFQQRTDKDEKFRLNMLMESSKMDFEVIKLIKYIALLVSCEV